MKRARWCALLCLLFILTGCSLSKPGPAPQPTPADAPPEEPAKATPPLPLWGPPDLTLLSEDGEPLTVPYQPITIKGVDLQPIELPQGTVLLHRKDDEVWLHGLLTHHMLYSPLQEPQRLYRLPLQVGDRWQIDFTAYSTTTFEVTALEFVQTPAGEQPAVRLSVSGRNAEEWWVPGYGLVRATSTLGDITTAVREVRAEPPPVPALGRPSPDQSLLLWSDDQHIWVANLEGEEKSSQWANDPRQFLSWVQAGEQSLLLAYFRGQPSMPVERYSLYRFQPESDRFEPIPWLSPAGEAKGLEIGIGEWDPAGLFRVKSTQRYPIRQYTYRFDGEVMRMAPEEERLIRAASPREFVGRLLAWPPLIRADFEAMFKEPDEGKAAQIPERRGYAWPDVRALPGEPNTFVVKLAGVQIIVQVERGAEDFQVVRYEWQP